MSNTVDIHLPASAEDLAALRPGCSVRLFGTIYTMRDAGHARALSHLQEHGALPFNLAGQALFYAGPTPPLNGRPFGAIGPTTSARMDAATPALLRAGITLTLGKGRRSAAVAQACAKTGSVYLVAVGGAAAYLAQFVEQSELVAWEDLGTEALRRLTLNGLPAFVGIDSRGEQLAHAACTGEQSANTARTGEQLDSGANTAFLGEGAPVQPGDEPRVGASVQPGDEPRVGASVQPDYEGAAQPSTQQNGQAPTQPGDKAPLFISFEGGEGVGKSTQIRLLALRLRHAGYEVLCLREPGGTGIGEQVRTVLLNTANTAMAPQTELLLYEAARAQLVSEVIKPALDAGKVVLVDRFFDSTTAYQASARGLELSLVEQANAMGSQGLAPTRTVLLVQDVDHGLAKATEAGADRLEAEDRDFHLKVHQGFEQLAARYPGRIRRVECQELKQDTHELIVRAVADLFDAKLLQAFEINDELLAQIKASK